MKALLREYILSKAFYCIGDSFGFPIQ